MSEWWTYSLSDFLMFSPDTYFRLFALYNAAVWPAQLLAGLVGLGLLGLLLRPGERSSRLVAGVLAAAWAWIAWAYFLEHYATINWAAAYGAAAFAAQAVLLLVAGALFGWLRRGDRRHPVGRAGLALYLFALLLQPLAGRLSGRPWAQSELFAIAPDPTAVATLGVLLTAARPSWLLLTLPLLWCLVSGATLWTMAVPQAWLMLAAAVLGIALAGWRRHDGAARAGL